jgi:hypothetical protein
LDRSLGHKDHQQARPEGDLFTEVVSGTPSCVVAAVASFVEAVYRGVAKHCQTPFCPFFQKSSRQLELTLRGEFALPHKAFHETDSGLIPAMARNERAPVGVFSKRYGTAFLKLRYVATKIGK